MRKPEIEVMPLPAADAPSPARSSAVAVVRRDGQRQQHPRVKQGDGPECLAEIPAG